MGERSVGPWEVFRGTTVQSSVGHLRRIAECDYWTSSHEDGSNEANARFIVLACNAHDDMLAALEEAYEVIDRHLNHLYQVDVEVTRTAKRARSAITKAKEGEAEHV